MKTPISAVIITRNDSHHMERCLKSLLWADEILVVDGESSDDTAKISQNPEAPWAHLLHFMTRPWDGFRNQRNFALKSAKHDWVLVMDTDEECSPELAQTIQKILSGPQGPPHLAYKVRRQEFFLGKPIYYGIWNPSYQDRFFLKTGVEYVNDIHEYPVFPSLPSRLEDPILHAPDFRVDRFLDKMNRYTNIEALDRYKKGQRTHLFRLLGAFPAMFLKNYFYYSAYKDGIHGLIISLLEGLSRVVRHIKIWQLMMLEKAQNSK